MSKICFRSCSFLFFGEMITFDKVILYLILIKEEKMNVIISYKHMDSSEAIDSTIKEKSEKLQKYFHKDITVRWVCSVNGNIQTSEAEVSGIGGAHLFASAEADNLYKTFDDVIQKLSRQARKKLTREHQKESELKF